MVSQAAQASQFLIRTRLDHGKASFVAVSRIFAVVWGFADIYLWKSVWDGVDCAFDPDKKSVAQAVVTLTVGVFGLQLGGAMRSAGSVPVGIVLDDKANMATAHLYFQSTVRTETVHIM